MAIMTLAKFHINQLMVTLIFGIRASDCVLWGILRNSGDQSFTKTRQMNKNLQQ